ncbi:hypothetical protein C9F11_42915 (plasmid) [Streptomyces sp. YIM 121038]|uniref:hypothetical protein n=1 Tax=Streptomyces sp. YIM 121038 TaxID=2136401 RepID=UPI001110C5E5|nr:hypothetical protein [Streptomyces sp. YIM 121038]QCX82163.1 hypothetical protein C9F11_42915 [Streptomyces sp. YIM 121038]
MSPSNPDLTKGPAEPAPSGCCPNCPISGTCHLASTTLTRCAVTGAAPPPEPPDDAPTAPAAAGLDITEVVSRGVEKAVGAAFGLGWTDLLAAVITRSNSTDADGNPVNWDRLQLPRNILCAAVANLVPIQGAPASRWAADAFTTYGLTAPLVPAGAVLAVAGAVCLASLAGGLVGLLCTAALNGLTSLCRLIWRFLRSRLGWIITRPVIWAAVSGLVIVTWRFLVHILAGA